MFIIGISLISYSLTYMFLTYGYGIDYNLEIILLMIGLILVIIGMIMRKNKQNRTKFEIKVNGKNTEEFIISRLNDNGYYLVTENNEEVYKKGVGFWTAIKYIKVEVVALDTINLYGFIRPAFGNEQNLNGFVGCVPKKQVSDLINKIIKEISQ